MLDAVVIAEKILARHGPAPVLDDVETLALQRAIEIISEASRHIPEETKARHATTPWRRIADIGNTLRHA